MRIYRAKRYRDAKVRDLNIFGQVFRFGDSKGVFIRKHEMDLTGDNYTNDHKEAGLEPGIHTVALVVPENNPQVLYLFKHESIQILKQKYNKANG